jgi:hypothetical protein
MRFIAQLFFASRRLEADRVLFVLASMRSFILSCCVALCRSEWPIPFVVGPDTIPNVEVSLESPPKPLPDVSNEIGRLEGEREDKQKAHKDIMIRAFNKELASARLRVAAVFDGAGHKFILQAERSQHLRGQQPVHVVEPAASFLKASAVTVVVAPEKHIPESARAAIAKIEDARVAAEDAWLEAAVAEMSRLTDMVVTTVESEINALAKASPSSGSLPRPTQFFQFANSAHDHGVSSATDANVRVVGASVPYPTVQTLVDSLESRRDISEEFGKAQALSMYLKLLEFENMLVDSGLKALATKSYAAK